MTRKLTKQHFWKWFERNNKEYLQLLNKKSKKEITYWVNELNAHLRAYYKFFDFSLVHESDGSKGKLTITVHGKERHFRRVDDFVATAPPISNWEICALEAPMPIDFFVIECCRDTGINPHEFSFIPGAEKALYNLVVYHPLYTKKRHEEFKAVAAAALYNLLGERSYGNDIQCVVRVGNASHAPKDSQLIHLEELPAYLDRSNSLLIVDRFGNIQQRSK